MVHINEKVIPNKLNKTIYANDFKCRNLLNPYIHHSLSANYSVQDNKITLTESGAIYLLAKVETNKTYTLSYTVDNGFNQIRVSDYNNGGSWIEYGRTNEENNGKITFTANSNMAVIALFNGTVNNSYVTDLQIEVGSEATPYTSYKNFDMSNMHIKIVSSLNTGTGIRLRFTNASQQFFIFGKCYINSADKLLEYHIGLQNGGLSAGLVRYKDLGGNIGVTPTINNTNSYVNLLCGSYIRTVIISSDEFEAEAI